MVLRPKHKGGLGVLNLRLQNEALLLKQLSNFYNHADIPWVQLIWSRYYQVKVPHASPEVGSFWWKDVAGDSHRDPLKNRENLLSLVKTTNTNKFASPKHAQHNLD
jgi:hypothetical protein